MGPIGTHCKIVAGSSVAEDIDAVLASVEDEVHHSVDLRHVGAVLTSAKDVRNHYIPRVDHNMLEGGRVVDSHRDPVYCSKPPRHQALCHRRLPHYFLHPREIHEWEELDYSIDHQGENAVVVAF